MSWGSSRWPSRSAPPRGASPGPQCSDKVTSAPTAAATVSTASTSFGKVLVIASGDYAGCSLYLLTSDQLHSLTGVHFACSDDPNAIQQPCDTFLWPALLTKGAPIAGPGVNPKLLGTVTRDDLPGLPPVQQVTYGGMPLYRFFLDEDPGETSGADLFDPVTSPTGIWYLVEPTPGQSRTRASSLPARDSSDRTLRAGGDRAVGRNGPRLRLPARGNVPGLHVEPRPWTREGPGRDGSRPTLR